MYKLINMKVYCPGYRIYCDFHGLLRLQILELTCNYGELIQIMIILDQSTFPCVLNHFDLQFEYFCSKFLFVCVCVYELKISLRYMAKSFFGNFLSKARGAYQTQHEFSRGPRPPILDPPTIRWEMQTLLTRPNVLDHSQSL